MEAKKENILFLLIASFLLQSSYCSACPQISTFHQDKYWAGYSIFTYLKIPNTNILLVNTSQFYGPYTYQSVVFSSIVYYIDISNTVDNVISSIQTNYPIIQMEYIQQTNQILVQNAYSLIFADLYTLNIIFSIQLDNLIGMMHISGTNYAIAYRYQFQMFVIDVIQRKQILVLDISKSGLIYGSYIVQEQLFSLQSGLNFIFAVYYSGPTTWLIDFETIELSFNGFFSQDQEQDFMAVQAVWRKQISLRQKNSQFTGSQLQQSQILSPKSPNSPQLNCENLNKSQQKSTFQLKKEKGSVYIKVLTNYLQITGSIIAIDASITSGSPETIFMDQINPCTSPPVLCQVESFDLEKNRKQDQTQKKLDQQQSNSSNNKIQHEIIFSEGSTNEVTNN
ncbi:hypothetical protein ABPG72_003289 [Tetrahymena utriculariae]